MQRLYRPSGLLVARVTGNVHGTCAPCTYIVYVCYGIVPCSGWNERLYHRPRRRAHVRSPAGQCALMLSLFLSADFNANERRRCANMKGGCAERERKRECLKSRLMIRDDTRHSSLSDVWLDCRYCSLSFIFRELSPPTHAYMRQCVCRIKARRA